MLVQIGVSARRRRCRSPWSATRRRARRRAGLDGAAAGGAALTLAVLWMTGTWVLRAPRALAAGGRALARGHRAGRRARCWSGRWWRCGAAAAGRARARSARWLPATAALLALACAGRAARRHARLGRGGRLLGRGQRRGRVRRRRARADHVATKDLRLIVRDRSQLLALVAAPIIFVGIQIFGAAGWDWSTASLERVAIAVVLALPLHGDHRARWCTCRPSGAASGSCARCRCRSAG